MKLDHCLTPYRRVNSKWIQDLNVSHETIKLSEKKHIGTNLLDINMSDFFKNITSPGKGSKSKNELVGLHQAEKLLYSKGHPQ